ncbi:hypothetical protein BKA57DRAFT_285981 [Linnemannia elongata]|nr:hypothetical protein BKA57DRAFT_285981 [Linnemannia elongata]
MDDPGHFSSLLFVCPWPNCPMPLLGPGLLLLYKKGGFGRGLVLTDELDQGLTPTQEEGRGKREEKGSEYERGGAKGKKQRPMHCLPCAVPPIVITALSSLFFSLFFFTLSFLFTLFLFFFPLFHSFHLHSFTLPSFFTPHTFIDQRPTLFPSLSLSLSLTDLHNHLKHTVPSPFKQLANNNHATSRQLLSVFWNYFFTTGKIIL